MKGHPHHPGSAGATGPASPEALGAIVALPFRAGALAAVIVPLANLAFLATDRDVVRVRDFALLWGIRDACERVGWAPLALLPAWVSTPYAVDHARGVVCLLGLGVLTHLAIFWALGTLIAAAVLLARTVLPFRGTWALGSRLASAYPATLVAGFLLPVMLAGIRAMPGGDAPRPSVLGSLAAGALVWAALLAVGQARLSRFLDRATRPSLVMVGTVAAAALLAISVAGRPQPLAKAVPSGRPNILLVSIDSLRSDHVHAYGYPRDTTPTIDRLAAEGALFRTVVSSTSWTLPAHMTLFTSQPPEQHGVVQYDDRESPETINLAQILSTAGYATAGFVCGTFLDAGYGFGRGFDHYDDYTLVKAFEPASFQGVTSPTLVDVTRRWLHDWDASGRRAPFFVFVHMWDVHYDYTPPPPYDSMFDPAYRGTVTGEDFELGNAVRRDMDRRDLEHVIALYDGEIRFTDAHVGHLLDALRTLGVLDDTIVAITSDHGEEFFEHGEKGHAKQLYDESLLVPLVIRFPRAVPAGATVQPQVRLMDVAPTLLALAGVPTPSGFGTPAPKSRHAERDLTPLLHAGRDGNPAEDVAAFSELKGHLTAVRTRNDKLIRHRDGSPERYRLASDPGEHENVYGREPPVDVALERELETWRDLAVASRGTPGGQMQLSHQQLERLRALGYVR